MGYIREPEGVDFVINGKPLTEKQKLELSEYIREDKKRAAKGGAEPAGKTKGKDVGYIKEPEGVDFVIKSKPLTKEAEREISAYIRKTKGIAKKKTNDKAKA